MPTPSDLSSIGEDSPRAPATKPGSSGSSHIFEGRAGTPTAVATAAAHHWPTLGDSTDPATEIANARSLEQVHLTPAALKCTRPRTRPRMLR